MKLKKRLSVVISGALALTAASVAATQIISAEGTAPVASVSLEEFWGDQYTMAETPAEDFIYHKDKNSGGIVITDYKGFDTHVRIPASINGTAVTEINFSNCNFYLESLMIPDTVEDIDFKAYKDIVAYLKTVKAPDKGFSYYYDEEADGIFITNYNASNPVLRIPDSIEIAQGKKNIKGIDLTACEKDLSILILPEKVEAENLKLGKYQNIALKMSEVNGVKLDGEYAKVGIEKINVPAAVLENNKFAFAGSAVRSAYIPAEVSKIPNWTFGNCEWLTDVVVAGSNVDIGEYCFYNCENLTGFDVAIADHIGNWAFSGCENLADITFSADLTYIGDGAFNRCEQMTVAQIGANVSYIGDYAFDGCEELANINVDEGNGKYISVDGVLFNKRMTEILKMPENSAITDYAIPAGVKTIGTAAFHNSAVQNITIPSGVTYIGKDAFVDSDIKFIGLPRSVTDVEYGAFGNAQVATNRFTSGSGDTYNGINTSLF